MRYVQAKRLDNAGGFGFELARHRLKIIFCKKLAAVFKLCYLIVALYYFISRHIAVFFRNLGYYLVFLFIFIKRNNVIRNVVNNVHRARANIKNYIVAALFILMDHLNLLNFGRVFISYAKNAALLPGGTIVLNCRLFALFVFASLVGNAAACFAS